MIVLLAHELQRGPRKGPCCDGRGGVRQYSQIIYRSPSSSSWFKHLSISHGFRFVHAIEEKIEICHLYSGSFPSSDDNLMPSQEQAPSKYPRRR